jgi:hypothetical protein
MTQATKALEKKVKQALDKTIDLRSLVLNHPKKISKNVCGSWAWR